MLCAPACLPAISASHTAHGYEHGRMLTAQPERTYALLVMCMCVVGERGGVGWTRQDGQAASSLLSAARSDQSAACLATLVAPSFIAPSFFAAPSAVQCARRAAGKHARVGRLAGREGVLNRARESKHVGAHAACLRRSQYCSESVDVSMCLPARGRVPYLRLHLPAWPAAAAAPA